MRRGGPARAWVVGSLLLVSPLALAQEAAPAVPDAAMDAPAPSCEEAGCGGTELDGVAIPEGIVGRVAWAESEGADCHRYRGRRICEGPRRVPAMDAAAEARADALGLLRTTHVARVAITRRPEDPWIAAAGSPPDADLAWPVAGGRMWRHHGRVRDIVRTKRGRIRRGRRTHRHEGVDIGAAAGTPILAANAGLVVYSDNGMSGYGNAVAIVHGDGSLTLYAHCVATFVVPGQRVERGQIIAAVGDTGLAHGAHLHFEYRVDGASLDPEPLFGPRADPASASDPATVSGAEGP